MRLASLALAGLAALETAGLACAGTAGGASAHDAAKPGDPASAPSIAGALRDALAAERAGDVDAAATAFAAIATAHPGIADVADLLRTRALAEASRHDDVIAAAREADARSPGSPWRTDWERLAGDAHEALGAPAEARSAWERALAATQDPARAGALREKLSLSLAAEGERRAAALLDLETWQRTPTDPAARRAGERLDEAERALGESLRTADAWDDRAQRLFDAGWSESALVATEAALAHGLAEPAAAKAKRRRAHCLFRLRRYTAAAEAFAGLGDDGEARLFRARSLARAGNTEQGIAALEAMAESAAPADAAQAHWYAGLLLENDDELVRARAHFEAVAAQTADPALASSALWRVAWFDFRDGAFAAARERLQRVGGPGADLYGKLQARYWAARAAEELGDTETGRAELGALAGDYGFSYYGWRARTRLGDGVPVSDVLAPPPAGPATIPPQAFERPRILLDAGLPDLAREEIARLTASGAGGATPSGVDRVALARLAVEADDYARAQSLLLTDGPETFQRRPGPGADEPYRLAYPEAFAGDVKSLSLASIPRELVWAIMREESGYRPWVVSVAGARGLMQLMPETGERMARGQGLRGFARDDLFDPSVNVRLGSAYLDTLAAKFPGRLSAAIASYNAGPEPVGRWLAQRADWRDDAFVEDIPYDQTRNYVKRVLRSLHVYQALYAP